MLLARSRVSHGSLYGLPLLLSPSPHSAMCHFQVSSHCWCVTFFVIGCWQITGHPISCCQGLCNLPWCPINPPPHSLLPGPESLMGPWYGLPLLQSPSPTLCPCATFRSPHTARCLKIF
ncbi:unnamed protein product [Staurois parvus]|uniref:Uncharacterized protein n=1 Tax=Staurois parvus TaxID=386267 RepID=A0ABN9GD25_9NEOB|nr:unnamed protein product [Staurois parvus]